MPNLELRIDDSRPVVSSLKTAAQGSLRLSEMDVLGRLGAVVSPVNGTAEFRLQLAQQRARALTSEAAATPAPTPLGLQEAYAHKAEFARSAKVALGASENRLVTSLELMEGRSQISIGAAEGLAEQEREVRKARLQVLDAEESKNLGELALQYNALQGDDGAQNGQQSFLSAVRASALARNANLENGARAIEQIRRAKIEIVAERERQKHEETERVERATERAKILQRPSSSPALFTGQLPLLRLGGLNRGFAMGQSASAPASAVGEADELAKVQKEKERWIQYVRDSLKSHRDGKGLKAAPKRAAPKRLVQTG